MQWIRPFVTFAVLLLAGAAASHAERMANAKKVLILGDSLTEGYGIAKENSFPSVLQQLLRREGSDAQIINGGESGSTSASGPARLQWQLKLKPDIVVIALGANDGLRGVPVSETRKNISEIISLAQKNNVKVLLAGMKLPPNYGTAYTGGFEKMFSQLAKQFSVPLIPFLLEGVAGDPSLNQEDGIHPNEKGATIVAQTVLKYLTPIL